MRFFRLCKYYWLKFKRLQGSPEAIAGGAAAGILIGLTPTLPFQTPLILLLTMVSRTSFAAGILSSWVICNPITMLPIYYLAFLCGNFLFGDALSMDQFSELMTLLSGDISFTEGIAVLGQLGTRATFAFVSGSLLFAVPLSVASYPALLSFIKRLRKMKGTRSATAESVPATSQNQ